MADDLTVAIERLRTSTQRLNQVCDAAAQTIRDVEAFLEESHIGIPAFVEFRQIPEYEDVYTSVCLGYCRYGAGKFRIVIDETPPWAKEPNDLVQRPWSECSRDDKLESFEKLPELLAKLADCVDERSTKAEQIAATVNASLQLSSKKRKGG